jgi:hypothetical protein
MSPEHATHAIIVKFLGEEAANPGPFALLGVPHEVSEQQIRRALERRLAQIDQHPHRRTPDADEVRLAIHAAVSQLLDPDLLSELRAHYPPGNPNTTPQAWKARGPKRVHDRITRSARTLIGMCGGWNSRSRKQLAHLARVHRVPATEIIRSLTGADNTAITTSTNPTPRRRSIPLPNSTITTWVLVYAAFAIMIVILAFQAYIPSKTLAPQDESLASSTPQIAPPQIQARADSTPARIITHHSALVHEITQAEKLVEVNPGSAVDRLTDLLPAFMEIWTTVPADDLELIAQSMRSIQSTAQSDPDNERALRDALMAHSASSEPQEIIAITALRDWFSTADDAVLFSHMLSESARQLASESATDDPAWWSSWVGAVRSIHIEDDAEQTSLILRALEQQLRADRSSSSWDRSASIFVRTLSWRPGSVERSWLLGMFTDPSVRSERLSPLTEAITTDSAASGILVTMSLSPDATMQDRMALADRYRDAWASNPDDPFLDRLNDSLISAISLTAPDADPDRAIVRFAELARLNAACVLLDRGESSHAADVFESDLRPERTEANSSSLGLEQDQEDDRLALSLINGNSENSELTVLYEIETNPRIGLNTAHAIVQIALTGSGRGSREYAERLIVLNANKLPILLAIDRILIVNRTTSRLQQIIDQIVDVPVLRPGPDWDRAAHRALMLAISSATQGSDDPASVGYDELITAFYAPRLTTQSSTANEAIPSALIHQLGARALKAQSRDRVVRVLQRHSIRRVRADSIAQKFVADQWAVVELQSLVLVGQLPGTESRVEQVLDELRARCDQSTSVQSQITQLERAQTQLWLIRFQEGSV